MNRGKGHILVVDDDEYILLSTKMLLEAHVDSVTTLLNPEEIPRVLSERPIDVVFLDMNYQAGDQSGQTGLSWISKILHLDPSISIIPVTAYGDIQLAVKAVRLGAVDFLLKPWQNEKLLSTALSARKLAYQYKKLERLQSLVQPENSLDALIGASDQIQAVKALILKVAPTDASVLILGENGTGKELVAQALHACSGRNKGPFVQVDLGAIATTLFESEIFGHVKGAFTDAREDRIGKLEVAAGGSVFLDEIGNLPMAQQAKLLRVLQEKSLQRVGSYRSVDIDFRLISATNANLNEMVKNGGFRQDLLYRLNTIEIVLPPLRERKKDIVLLAKHFLGRYSRKYQKHSLSFSQEVLNRFQRYPWPGNVRELQHAMERAVILSTQDTLIPSDFFFLQQDTPASPAESLNLEELEAWAVRTALTRHGGNVTRASEELGITRGAMYRRMEKHGL